MAIPGSSVSCISPHFCPIPLLKECECPHGGGSMAQAGSAVHLASVRKDSERAEPAQLARAGLETPAQSFPG